VDFLSLIERGVNSPSFEVLERMAARLDLEVRELFDFRKPARDAIRQSRGFDRIAYGEAVYFPPLTRISGFLPDQPSQRDEWAPTAD
jgi:transcriptional regulator with XRE-family HTH domain